jgi:hypothetical protein
MKNSIDTVGNRTRDLPSGNAVPHELRHNTTVFNQFNSEEILNYELGQAVIILAYRCQTTKHSLKPASGFLG